MSQVLLRLVEYPELVKPLRDEAIQVFREKGWSIQSLYQLRLMDSFFKECQRHDRPLGELLHPHPRFTLGVLTLTFPSWDE